MRKKVKALSNEQWIEILEESEELQQLNEALDYKIIIRDLIK
jgi:hypothetical protein